ncbi:heme exporter protein CcmD [Aliiglaciecola litoralis]|uniref:Heme exporter protein D n=1 Tax=Aliiglaciecola litoralis TaxID=582857 RepID=A0ABP3WS31_9ALTE
MTFQFESWQAFWQMGGYGFYVWLAFGVSLLAVLALVYESIWTKQQLIKAVNAQIARKQRIKQAKMQSNKQTESTTEHDKSEQEVGRA